jgi:hypothetical protein
MGITLPRTTNQTFSLIRRSQVAALILMPKFLTIGYGDEAGYNRTPIPIRDAAHRHDARLLEAGAIIGIAGSPIQVRNPEGQGVETTAGAFMRSDLPIAGFALIDAENIEHAIDQVAQTPCAVAYGVVEIWPL